MTKARVLEAIVYKSGQLRCVDVPSRDAEALGGGRAAVLVKIADAEEQTSLVPKREGGHRLFLAAALRKAAGVDAGDRVVLEVRPDPKGGEPDLPEELIVALGRIAGGMEELLSGSPADRRQLLRFIESAKSPGVRAGRIKKVVEMVMQGKPKKKR